MNTKIGANSSGPTLLRYRGWLIALLQAVLIFASLTISWFLRFDFSLPYSRLLIAAALILITLRMGPIAYFGLLHGWWRYVGVRDAYSVFKAVICGSITFFVVMRYLLGVLAFPRTVYILEGILTAIGLIGIRLLSRTFAEHAERDRNKSKRVLLIGAGSAAQMILREISRPNSAYTALGCLDDDLSKRGICIEGVKVLGGVDELAQVLQTRLADEILIVAPSATDEQMQRFIEICDAARIKFRTVPAIKDVLTGHVSISQLREVSVNDLLGRQPAKMDLASVRRQISGRNVIVTGAAGSIGSEICQQILDCSPRSLICLDQSETGLFYLQIELSKNQKGVDVKYVVADVTDEERIRWILQEFAPELVFHVAAYKHVPMMELNVHEAVKNNIFGLVKLLDLAESAACTSFVFISSDKAVNPSSVMGATKRIGELILATRPSRGMRAVAVRFGNVLGSSGSVVPVMLDQLKKGQPLTVTHPEIRRYFMTIPEAVALVLQAFAIGSHGDILVLDMGRSIRIADLARNLIRLAGKTESEVPIEYIGLRLGEKLEEELFYDHEDVLPTQSPKVTKVACTLPGWPELQHHLAELSASMYLDGAEPIRAKLREIVPQFDNEPATPEFNPPELVQVPLARAKGAS